MRIGINGVFVGNAHNGITTYTEGVVRMLASVTQQPVVYSSGPRLQSEDGCSVHTTPKLLRAENGTLASLARVLWTQAVLPFKLRQDKVDVLFSPLAEGIFRCSVPQVIQVHDLIPLFYPDECPRWHYYYRSALPRLLQRAAMVLTDSAHTRSDVLREYKVSPERVTVVYPGIHSSFFSHETGQSPAGIEAASFFLFVGTHSPRKNLPTVLRAFAQIHREVKEQLIVLAYPDRFMASNRRLASELGVESKVRFLSGLTRNELLYLYRQATALLLLSEYEGFGYPAVEAMAVGTPSIVSDSTSIAEIVADAGIQVPCHEIDSAASAMRRIVSDHDFRKKLSERGIEQAKKFTWDNTFAQLSQVLCSYARN